MLALLLKGLQYLPAIENVLLAGILILFLKDFFGQTLLRMRLGLLLRLPRSITAAKIVLLVLAVLAVSQALIFSVGQYAVWKESKASAFLLPPYQPIQWFFGYVWQRFGKEPAAELLLAGIVFLALKIGNALTRERLFYDEEPYFAAIAVVAAGWPWNLFVIAGAFLLACFLQIFFLFRLAITRQPVGRFSLVYFWIPLGIVALNFGAIIGEWVGLTQFKL